MVWRSEVTDSTTSIYCYPWIKIYFIYLDLASEVPPATSKCETACAELESNPWFIHENPADISRRKDNCIYESYLNFFFLLQS